VKVAIRIDADHGSGTGLDLVGPCGFASDNASMRCPIS
jgi:hypothetical protein